MMMNRSPSVLKLEDGGKKRGVLFRTQLLKCGFALSLSKDNNLD